MPSFSVINGQFRILVVVAIIFCIDQTLKAISLKGGMCLNIHEIPVAYHVFINHESLLGNNSMVHVILSLSILSALIFLSTYRSPTRDFRIDWGIALIAGGFLSNEIDRIIRGSVVDYIEIWTDELEIFFNLADITTITGMVFLSFAVSHEICVFIERKRRKA